MNKVELFAPCQVVTSPQRPYRTVAGSFTPSEQPDLLYMESVLVSTGANLNDDVFLPSEVWKAKSTPVLKPVDWEHNTGKELLEEHSINGIVIVDNQIIGVMYNTYATDKDGNIIDDDSDVPDNFHLVDEAVIWKGLFPSIAKKIEEGAQNNKLFVSMEAWFNDYDYLVGDKIVARNEETAFLDDSLRANGGTGSFANATVKRVLKNITFGGKGIVEKPANKPSVIKSVTHSPIKSNELALSCASISKNITGTLKSNGTIDKRKDLKMSDEKAVESTTSAGVPIEKFTAATDEAVTLRGELKTVSNERDSAIENAKELESKIETITSAFSSGAVALDEVLPGIKNKLVEAKAEDFFSVLVEAISANNSAFDEVKTKLAEATQELEKQAAEAKKRERLSAIESALSALQTEDNAEFIKTKSNKILSMTESMNDEDFVTYLNDYKETVALITVDNNTKEQKEETEAVDKSKKAEKMEDEEDKEDEEEMYASVIDNVEASESAPSAGETSKPVNFENAFAGLVTTMLKAHKPASSSNKD